MVTKLVMGHVKPDIGHAMTDTSEQISAFLTRYLDTSDHTLDTLDLNCMGDVSDQIKISIFVIYMFYHCF